VNKSHPCGAGLASWASGLPVTSPPAIASSIPISTNSETSLPGSTTEAIRLLGRGNIHPKTDCHTCWPARSVLAAVITKLSCAMATPVIQIFTIATGIRGWTHTCLEIYGALAEKNPAFLDYFAERKAV